jgi:hypothetical protein
MSTVPPENEAQFKHDVITRFVSVRCVKSFGVWVRVVVFNATFNNMSVISWRSALFMKVTGVPGENHLYFVPVASH